VLDLLAWYCDCYSHSLGYDYEGL